MFKNTWNLLGNLNNILFTSFAEGLATTILKKYNKILPPTVHMNILCSNADVVANMFPSGWNNQYQKYIYKREKNLKHFTFAIFKYEKKLFTFYF